jgi:uncharacterized Fe-S cluster-containing radical SAM superfamily protein
MEEREVYKFEDIARIGIINTGGNQCSIGCTYCFYKYENPQNFCRNDFLTMKKFLSILEVIPKEIAQISIEGLWVDPFMNKNVYDFIIEVSSRFPKSQIMVCTHGVLMTSDGIKKLRDLSNFYIALSVNTFDVTIRRWISKIDNVHIVVEAIQELATHPLITDFGSTEAVLQDYAIWKKYSRVKHNNLHIRRMEYNKYFPDSVIKYSIAGTKTIYKTAKCLKDQGVRVVVLGLKLHELLEFANAEIDTPFKNGLKELHHVLTKMNETDLMITTSMSLEYIEHHITKGKILVVKNNVFGGNYDTCGFLTFKDITTQVKAMGQNFNRIFIPSHMFRLSDNDGTGRKYDLLGDSLYDQELNFITHDVNRINQTDTIREISKKFINNSYYPMRW